MEALESDENEDQQTVYCDYVPSEYSPMDLFVCVQGDQFTVIGYVCPD